MGNAYIVGAVRTPGGRKNGKLSQWHPTDLGALVLDELVDRTGVKPELIDDVIFGCVSQSGAQSGNVARKWMGIGNGVYPIPLLCFFYRTAWSLHSDG